MYKLTNSTGIVRLADFAGIPNDPANNDYAAYLQWLSEGNTPLPVDPPTPAELNAPILAKMAEVEHRILCALCEQDAEYMALKAQLIG